MTSEELEQLLCRHDPVGIAGDTPVDEYRPEAESILPRLGEATGVDDVQRILHEEFTSWFTAEVAGPAEAYADAAREIWQTLATV